METSTVIIIALVVVISIILILSIVHIASKVDEIASYTRRMLEITEKNNKKE